MKTTIQPKNLILYLVCLIASIVFASFFGGPVAFVWLYCMLLLPILSIAYIALNYHFLSLYQEVEVHKLSKRETHNYRAVLENSGFLPIHNMSLSTFDDRCDLHEIENGRKLSLDIRDKIEICSGISCRYAGAYNVGIKTVSFSDPFNTFCITLDVPYSFKAIVRPQITDVANKTLDLENMINNSGFKSANQVEDIPGNDMRSYQNGDSLSAINWKVSAKFNQLMVRLPNPMDKRTVTIIMEASDAPENKQEIEFLKKRDYFLEFVVSAAWHFSRQGVPLSIIYPSGDIKTTTVNTYDSFTEFYNKIADGLFYNSSATKEKLHSLVNEKGDYYGNDTCILLREDCQDQNDFCTIIC